jgi:uncharacterized protein with HEPN domain
MRDIQERLRVIHEAIRCIEKYTQGGRELFDQNELIQTWVIHHLEIISEAARAIPQDYRSIHPEIPWNQISGMHNILIYIDFDIDRDIVWAVVEHDLPHLKSVIEAILTENK